MCNQKLTGVSSGTVTLVSGTLPTGLGLHSDGTLYGVPTTAGSYTFIILNDRYCTYKGIEVPVNTSSTVADINNVYDYAKDSVESMYRAGILNSDSANYFHPKNHTTRADAAYILAQFLFTY